MWGNKSPRSSVTLQRFWLVSASAWPGTHSSSLQAQNSFPPDLVPPWAMGSFSSSRLCQHTKPLSAAFISSNIFSSHGSPPGAFLLATRRTKINIKSHESSSELASRMYIFLFRIYLYSLLSISSPSQLVWLDRAVKSFSTLRSVLYWACDYYYFEFPFIHV